MTSPRSGPSEFDWTDQTGGYATPPKPRPDEVLEESHPRYAPLEEAQDNPTHSLRPGDW